MRVKIVTTDGKEVGKGDLDEQAGYGLNKGDVITVSFAPTACEIVSKHFKFAYSASFQPDLVLTVKLL